MPLQIFVTIASYRDTECRWSIKDLFEKASLPDRISVGVVWQYDPEEDQECFQIVSRPSQVRNIMIDWHQSCGPTWARALGQTLWNGEDYVLQIDSHTRFVNDWDRIMLEQIHSCQSSKPLLTTYPLKYEPPNKLSNDMFVFIAAMKFNNHGILTTKGLSRPVASAPKRPVSAAFCSAGFIFGPATWIKEIPYDPNLYFTGEEISLAVRGWTHGWDLFCPSCALLYHEYGNSRRRGKMHWENHPDWSERMLQSNKRIRHLLEMDDKPQETGQISLNCFGLGGKRSLADYQKYSGVDFRKMTLAQHALEGKFS